MAARIQRRRTPGWKRPLKAVIVDRTSRFGNPFRVVNHVIVEHPADGRVWTYGTPERARRQATALYREWLDGAEDDTFTVGAKTYDRRRILAGLPQLRGRDLACPCPLPEPGQPDHCHASVLLQLANQRETEGEQR